jgi:hypothetical protein
MVTLAISGLIVLAALLLMGGFVGGVYAERYWGVPLWQTEDRWSIGIFTSHSPAEFSPPPDLLNPVLTAGDVSDREAIFVADPFMVREDSLWYMFFEVLDKKSYQGKIALATSQDGLHWTYKQTVLDEPYHLSYPYVFKWQDCYYMLPDCQGSDSIRLYKAVRFPEQWEFVAALAQGNFADASILQYRDRWWMFVSNPESSRLRLFYADHLAGPWSEHPQSPVIEQNAHISRPAGRVLVLDGRVLRYAQDDNPAYGIEVHAFEITELSTTRYQEREFSQRAVVKATGVGWNAHGMHHVDPHQIGEHQWIACVDGNQTRTVFRLMY